jgi:hypothetical protein
VSAVGLEKLAAHHIWMTAGGIRAPRHWARFCARLTTATHVSWAPSTGGCWPSWPRTPGSDGLGHLRATGITGLIVVRADSACYNGQHPVGTNGERSAEANREQPVEEPEIMTADVAHAHDN